MRKDESSQHEDDQKKESPPGAGQHHRPKNARNHPKHGSRHLMHQDENQIVLEKPELEDPRKTIRDLSGRNNAVYKGLLKSALE